MNFQEKLDVATEKAAFREFEVTITETLEKKVKMQANNKAEAEEIVNNDWINGAYILDAESFKGVEFNASAVKRQHNHDAER